jgi:hypothetical protein
MQRIFAGRSKQTKKMKKKYLLKKKWNKKGLLKMPSAFHGKNK